MRNELMKNQLNTLIVEENSLLQKRLIKLVQENSFLHLGGLASNMRQFQAEVRHYSYDLVLLDVWLHGESTFDFLRRSRLHGCVVVVADDRNHAFEAYELDAVDYLAKPLEKKRFVKAVEKVFRARGQQEEKSFTGELYEEQFEKILMRNYGLSKAETAVCTYVLQGVERSQVAGFLGIGPVTLKSHLRNIYKKTIEINAKETVSSHGKLQRLTTFLYALKPSSALMLQDRLLCNR